MSTEQRVIAGKPKIGARPAPAAAPEPEAQAPAGGGKKKKLVIIALVVLLLGGGAGYWFLMGPGAAPAEGEAAAEEVHPEPGEVVIVEPVSINLAGGHYLRLGLGLQLTADVHGDVSAAQALDLAIALFSGKTIDEVRSPEGREALKAELLHGVEEAYHHQVIDLYFTDYVTQ